VTELPYLQFVQFVHYTISRHKQILENCFQYTEKMSFLVYQQYHYCNKNITYLTQSARCSGLEGMC